MSFSFRIILEKFKHNHQVSFYKCLTNIIMLKNELTSRVSDTVNIFQLSI